MSYDAALLFITGLGYFVLASSFSKLAMAYAAAGWMTALCGFAALALVIAALLRAVVPARVWAYIFAISLVCVAVLSLMGASGQTALPTDEVGITGAAAQAVLSGHNPYTADLLTVDPRIAAEPSSWYTQTFSGGRVSEYAYPAGTFLVLAPLVAVFGVAQLTHLLPILFLLTVALAWLVVPQRVRPFLTVLLFLMAATGALTGSTDPVYLPFLLLALWRWPRFVVPEAGVLARLGGPVALGIACSMKQNAWVVAPFLLLGIVLEARARGRGGLRQGATYTAVAVAAFVVVNAPFMVLDWHAWSRAIALPLTLHTVLLGNGVAAIPLSGAAGGDHLELLSLAAAAALVATLALAAATYSRARLVLPLLPVIALMFSTRSLTGYLFFLLVPAVVAATTLLPLPERPALPLVVVRRLRSAGALAAAAAVALTGFTLAQPSPLVLAVTSASVAGTRWDDVEVAVANRSGRPITPHFYAAVTEVDDYVLTTVSGPAELGSGATATYRLKPLPGDTALTSGVVVRIVVLSDQPESISQSSLYRIGGGPVGD